ncbi:hypothetical protein [Brevibacillus porteri]|uniref:hypothetical protein n=1 Tax=Brevibacillus porteri TaxID=2126350 RepID=UPI003D1E21F1
MESLTATIQERVKPYADIEVSSKDGNVHWPRTSFDRLEEDLDRPVQIIEGCEWEPTTDSYDISPEVSHLYEKTRQKVFAILEPEADKENKQHPELYGKRCIYCRIWTRDFSKQKCPKCSNELLEFPLNEWD